MRLVSFGPPGAERPGIVDGEHIVDLLAVDGTLPPTVRDILAADLVEDAGRVADSADDDARFALDAVRLGPPVLEPSKIICLGRNYRDHAREQNQKPPEFPMLFSKGPNVLCGDGDGVPYPAGVEELDYEVELAFVIGRRARRVTREGARAHVAGYGVFIDLTARDLQRREKQWFRGKSFDGAGPFGPWLVTSDEIPDPHDLAISLEVNGETRQSSTTGEMNFGVDFLVHYLSQTMTLEPGDIIATGTPSGVGAFRDPPVFLQRGDRLSATIGSIGTLGCAIA
jgi:2-keto-4-pentenoate hydratase/2-oxohepta-3-ene-1,7-dioic acid hydratase in catechol pathway